MARARVWCAITGRISRMSDDLYVRKLMDLSSDLPRAGRLDAPDGTATAHSRLCGSTVVVDVSVDGEGRVTDYAHDVRACMLGKAAASLVARHVVGATLPEVSTLRDTVRAMLKEDGPPPVGRWEAFEALLPVRAYKARHSSTLLALDATVDALAVATAA